MKLNCLTALGLVAFAVLLYGCGGATVTGVPDESTPAAEGPGTDTTPPPEEISNESAPPDESPTTSPPTDTDTVQPTISTVTPAVDAVSVATDITVTITFSEAMDRTSVEGAFTLSDDAAINGTFSWTDDSTVVFTPSANLLYLTTYTISLSSTAKDKAGNVLASEYISNFTTEDRDIALLLDGDADGARFDGLIFPIGSSPSLTVEAWVYPTANKNMVAVSDNAYALGVAQTSSGPALWVILRPASCSTGRFEVSMGELALNRWNHIAFAYDSDTRRIGFAINGMVIFPNIFTGDFCSDLSYKFGIGNYNSDTRPIDKCFAGRIKEVRVSNIVRYVDNFTPEEKFTSDANTIGLWHFDEAADATSFSDSSGNGYTLTAVGDAKTGR